MREDAHISPDDLPDDVIVKVFERIDFNHNGSIEYREFVEWLEIEEEVRAEDRGEQVEADRMKDINASLHKGDCYVSLLTINRFLKDQEWEPAEIFRNRKYNKGYGTPMLSGEEFHKVC